MINFSEIKNITKRPDGTFDVASKKSSNNYRFFGVDWRRIQRFDQKGNVIDPEIFKQQTIEKNGIEYFNQNFACVSGDTVVNVYDGKEYKITIGELWNKSKETISDLKILTQSGYSTFAGIRQRTRKTLKVSFETGDITVTPDHKFVVNNQEITAKDLKVGDFLQGTNGLVKVTSITNDKTQKVYDVLETEDHTYVTNDIISHNCQFLGSSSTLINSKILAQMNSVDPEYIRDNKLKVFEEPKKGHSYIMAVDPAKDGIDAFAIHVMDVTTINFVEVACAQLQIDYLKMPAWLDSWGKWYNYAFLIIENNEGAGQSIADIMFRDYEYENLYFDKQRALGTKAIKQKPYPGFRTTSKTRKLILDNLRTFIEQGKLEVRSKETIEEFYHFILIDEKYQADDGYHDDMIMSLAITFAPFCETKNFDDLKGMVDALYSKEQAFNENNFDQFMTIGFVDENGDEEFEEFKSTIDPWNPWDAMDID